MTEHTTRIWARPTARQLHAALTILGMSGIALSFFPFAFSYLPIRDVFPPGFLEPSWWTVLPCMLLPLPIAIGFTVWLTRGLLPRWWSTSAYIIAGLSVGPFLAGLISDFAFDDIGNIAYPALFLAAFCAAAGLVIWGKNRGQRLESLIAMQSVYIVQMQYWLVLAAGEFQTGAWLGAATSLAYLGQIMLVANRRAWLLLLLVPGAVLAITLLAEG